MSDAMVPPAAPDNRLSLLQSVLATVNLGAIVLDGARRVVLWNTWMERYSGLAGEQVLGQDLFALFPELRGQRLDAAIQQALYNNFRSLLSQTLNKAPFPLYTNPAAAEHTERIQQAVEVTPIAVDGEPRHCLVQITDVSMAVGREKLLRDQAMELRSQTFSDGLTGIANRRHFDAAMEKEHRRAKRSGIALSLLMLDIDNFKAYNDHYGHQKGDQCLIQVAAALSAMLKRPGDMVARYGGEEFAIILPETGAEQALMMAEALRQRTLELAIVHEENTAAEKFVTISIGVATQAAEAPVEIEALIGAADRALYAAKRGGRNRVEAQLL